MADTRLLTRPFVLVSVANFMQGMAFSLFLHFSGFLQGLGASEVEIGLIVGLAAVASVVVRPWVGRAMDLHGRRVVIIGGNLLNVAVIGLYLTVSAIGPWVYLVRIFHGLAEAVLFTAYFTYGADVVPASRRTQGLALFGVSGLLPIALAGLVGDAILSVADFDALFLVTLGFAVASLLVALPLADLPAAAERPRGFWASLSQPDLLPVWWLTFVFSVALTSYFTFLRTFVDETGVGTVGLFFACYAGTAILLRLVGGSLPDRLGLKRVLYPAMAAFAAGFAVLAGASTHAEVAVAGVLSGIGHGYVFPILYTMTVVRARASERGAAMAIFTGLFDVGLLAGGPALGAVIRYVDYTAMFAAAAGFVAVGSVAFALWDRRVEEAAPAPESPAPAVPL